MPKKVIVFDEETGLYEYADWPPASTPLPVVSTDLETNFTNVSDQIVWRYRNQERGEILPNDVKIWMNAYILGAIQFFNLTIYWPRGAKGPQTRLPDGTINDMLRDGWYIELPENRKMGEIAWEAAKIRPTLPGIAYRPGSSGGTFVVTGRLLQPGTKIENMALGFYSTTGSGKLTPVSYYFPFQWVSGSHLHVNGWWEVPVE